MTSGDLNLDTDQTNPMDVVVYRSRRREETYLFLPAQAAYDELPEALQTHFGEAESFLEFTLYEERYLSQSDSRAVLNALREQGFYLQLPPVPDNAAPTAPGAD